MTSFPGLPVKAKNPTIFLFIDALFQEYYDWTYASYPAPYHLGNGEVEDFSLKGMRKRIQQCVEFHNKVKVLQPANEKYTIYKAVFQVRNLPINLFFWFFTTFRKKLNFA